MADLASSSVGGLVPLDVRATYSLVEYETLRAAVIRERGLNANMLLSGSKLQADAGIQDACPTTIRAPSTLGT